MDNTTRFYNEYIEINVMRAAMLRFPATGEELFLLLKELNKVNEFNNRKPSEKAEKWLAFVQQKTVNKMKYLNTIYKMATGETILLKKIETPEDEEMLANALLSI